MRYRNAVWIILLVFASWLVPYAAGMAGAQNKRSKNRKQVAQADFGRELAPLVAKYCTGCHGEKKKTAGVALHTFKDRKSVLAGRAVWETALNRLKTRTMPPKKAPQPTDAERAKLVAWLEATLSAVDCDLKHPGRVTLRRLNRSEYDNTIRDLVGVDFQPAKDFPSDDVGYGFDNIGDVLSLPPLLMEKYLAAGEQIVDKVLIMGSPLGTNRRYEAEALPGDGNIVGGFGRNFFTNGGVSKMIDFPKTAQYILRARAYGQQAGPEACKLAFKIDGQTVYVAEVKAVQRAPQVYEVRVGLSKGRRKLEVAFINDYYNPKAPNPRDRDRNLILDYFEVQGPIESTKRVLPDTHKRIITVRPKDNSTKAWDDAARVIIASFGQRAFRRPLNQDEVTRYLRYPRMAKKEGDTFERGIGVAMQAMLVSPYFLFHVETGGGEPDEQGVIILSDYEIASRLSYFLWSSMPDEELFALAKQGKLQDPAVRERQVRRMMRDPKVRALAQNFAGQWLQLRNLDIVSPDTDRFPGFSDELRQDMRTETEMFFESVVREDRSVLDFIDGKFTFVNERLAKHYGLDWVKGKHFRKVVLKNSDQRGGVLTQASVLTVTSNPTRTSPVKRGKWIMENILGTPPPDPPANVPPLPEDQEAILSGSLRQRLERHRVDPNCAVCHNEMDALGFAFENYDAVGAWRTKDGKFDIDPSGKLPGGRSFKGPAELRRILKGKRGLFLRCLTEKLLTYSLGRGLEYYDKCAIDEITRAAAKKKYRFSAIVLGIVESDPFLLRRGEVEEGK